jgi:hypothetical protein
MHPVISAFDKNIKDTSAKPTKVGTEIQDASKRALQLTYIFIYLLKHPI